MNSGPFNDQINAEVIPEFIMGELFPSLEKIRTLCSNTYGIDRGYIKSVDRSEINDKTDEYRGVAKEFLDLYIKWNTPDRLYEGIDPGISDNASRMAGILQEYYNYGLPMRQHFEEGFRLLDQIDRSLTSLNNASFARLSLGSGLVAIVISLIVAIIAGS